MTKETPAKTETKTVKMVNEKRSNGTVGATAKVAEKDVKVWADKGWSEVK